ncbi:hypothetical protein A2U01_0043889, partial [Trifolium medium]|nr:hypothetical protein [Trifolium medium]
ALLGFVHPVAGTVAARPDGGATVPESLNHPKTQNSYIKPPFI